MRSFSSAFITIQSSSFRNNPVSFFGSVPRLAESVGSASAVLSFVLEESDNHVEGEVIISADTAAESAAELSCSPAAEQLLYVIHGVLHLIGFRDKTPSDAEEMRSAEAKFLRQFGFEPSASADSGADATNGASTS